MDILVLWWPLLCGMKDTKYFDRETVLLVHKYVICPKDQFPGAINPARPTHFRKFLKHLNFCMDIVPNALCSFRIVIRDLLNNRQEVSNSKFLPFQFRHVRVSY